MATYYLDSVAGNDGNSGTSEAQAWASINKLNAITLNPGDEVRFKNGQTFQGYTYSCRVSGKGGTALSPIVFRPYTMDDVLPIIDGGLTLAGGWTQHATNIWKCTPGTEINGVSVDGEIMWWRGGHVSPVWLPTTQDPNTLTANAPWTYQAGVLYLYLEDDPAGHTIVGCVRDVWDMNNLGGVEIEQLSFRHAQDRAMRWRNSNNNTDLVPVTWSECEFILNGYKRSAGVISCLAVVGGRLTGCTITDNTNDAFFGAACPDWEVDNNFVARLFRWESDGIQFEGNVLGWHQRGNDGFNIHHNTIQFSDEDGAASSDSLKGALICNGPIGKGSGSIHHNDIQGGDFGINVGVGQMVVEDNVVHGQAGETWASGIYVGGNWEHAGHIIRRNVVYGAEIGISVTQKGFAKHRGMIAHNTVAKCGTGLQTLDAYSGAIVNNIIWCEDADGYIVKVLATPGGEHLTLDHNLYGPEGQAKFGSWAGVDKATLAAWQAASGQDAHSIVADPMFLDPDNNDFRLDPDSPAREMALAMYGPGQGDSTLGAL